MIYTSYFAQLRNLPDNIIPISICAKAPEWYKGLQYKKLAPKYGFFMEWKKNKDNDYYIEHFNKEVLASLSQLDILFDIYNILPNEFKDKLESDEHYWYNNPDYHIALICYEKPEDFCHRHLVAEWLSSKLCIKKVVEWNKSIQEGDLKR